MNISQKGVEFIIKEEGCVNNVYLDSAGKPTIGIGHLIKDGEEFDTLDDDACLDLLKSDLDIVEATIAESVNVELSQNQYDALCSLIFNIGCTAFENSTVLKRLNKSEYEKAADAFLMWCKITRNGIKVTSQALMKRRDRERELFLKED